MLVVGLGILFFKSTRRVLAIIRLPFQISLTCRRASAYALAVLIFPSAMRLSDSRNAPGPLKRTRRRKK